MGVFRNACLQRKKSSAYWKFEMHVHMTLPVEKYAGNTIRDYISRLMGKPTICICENKGADQLRGNREADQRLCFRYSDNTVPLLLKFEISRF